MIYEEVEVGHILRHELYGTGTVTRKYIEINDAKMIAIELNGDGNPAYSTACEIVHCEPYEWELV